MRGLVSSRWWVVQSPSVVRGLPFEIEKYSSRKRPHAILYTDGDTVTCQGPSDLTITSTDPFAALLEPLVIATWIKSSRRSWMKRFIENGRLLFSEAIKHNKDWCDGQFCVVVHNISDQEVEHIIAYAPGNNAVHNFIGTEVKVGPNHLKHMTEPVGRHIPIKDEPNLLSRYNRKWVI